MIIRICNPINVDIDDDDDDDLHHGPSRFASFQSPTKSRSHHYDDDDDCDNRAVGTKTNEQNECDMSSQFDNENNPDSREVTDGDYYNDMAVLVALIVMMMMPWRIVTGEDDWNES